MPDNSDNELDSPTTVVGEGEPFSFKDNNLLVENKLLTAQLEHAEAWIKTLEAEFEFKIFDYQDYQSFVKGQFEIKDRAIQLASKQLAEKDQKIADLKRQLNQTSYLLEQEQLNNQIAYDILNSLGYERDILAKKYAFAKGKINRRENKINQLETEIKKITQKYWRERKEFIKHDIQLAEEQKKIRKLRKRKKELHQDYKELDNQYDKLEKQKNKFKNRLTEQVNNLKKLNLNKKTIQQELKWAKDNFDELDFKLEVRTKKLARARNKIRDLENKQKELKTVAENKKVSLTLIKYTLPLFGNKKPEENPNLEGDIMNTSHSLVNTIADTQNYLKVNDLTQITTSHQMPKGKSLTDLITFYQENKDKVPTSPSQPRVITELELGEPNETVIVNQIIQECDLGLVENSSLTQVIEQINKLIKTKPPIIRPVNQSNDTPFGEDLEKIIQIDLNSLEQELNILLSSIVKEQIKKATNYQELSSIRNQEIKNYLEKGQNNGITTQPAEVIKPMEKERVIWISLLVICLMVIGGLLVKLRGICLKRKRLGKSKSF